MLHAVVETPTFLADAKTAGMEAAERLELIALLAADPMAGDLMVGTGGARKLRFRRPGTGKSGGYRVITFFAAKDLPVFLLNVFTKGERANLSQAERNALRLMLAGVADSYRRGRGR